MKKYFNDPLGIELVDIAKNYKLDLYMDVKEASTSDIKPSINDFAYPEKLLYPVHTPEATALSWCYVKENSDLPKDIKQKALDTIKEAAEYWDVKLPSRIKEEKEQKQTLTFKVATEDTVDTYTIHAPGNITQIYEQITKRASDYTYDTRQQLAEQILSAPSYFKADLSTDQIETLQKIAGDMLVTADDIKNACNTRAYMIDVMGKPELAEILKEAAESTPAEGIAPKKVIVKIANMLDFASRSAGIKSVAGDKAYGNVEDLFNGIPERGVRYFHESTVALKNGSAVRKIEIVKNREAINSFFDKYAGEDVTSLTRDDLIDKIEELPESTADAFSRIVEITI